MEFENSNIVSQIRKFNYHDLIIFLIPITIFSIYLSVFNPGMATIDSFNQLHQIASGQFTNWHPFFHTFIEMLCLKIYPSTISIGILQILVFSAMWTVICKYNRDDNEKKTFIMQAILSAVICIIPINGLYSITLWKDILFSYFLMFLCFLCMIMINKKGNVGYKFIIVFCLILAMIAQLRGNGLYVGLISMAIYSIYLFLKKNRKMSALVVIITIASIFLISSLNIAYDVQDNEKDAVMTKVIHMLADYDLNLEMKPSDKAKIDELINKDKVKDYYRPTESDSILLISNLHLYEKNKTTYIDLALKYSLKYPLHCLKYLFGSSPMTWNIIKDHWAGRPYYISTDHDRLQADFNTYYGNHKFSPTTPYENLSYANWGTPTFDAFNNMARGFERLPMDSIFNNPATYMYLSIIILILISVMIKSREIFLMYVPNLLNIIMIFLSTPIQDYRYLYANLLICYMLMIVLIGLWPKYKDNIKVYLKR